MEKAKNMRLRYQCAVCPTTIREAVNGKIKKNHEYNVIDVELNIGSLMAVGVCSKHTQPTTKELSTMDDKIHRGWDEEVAIGVGNKEWVEQVAPKLVIVGTVA